MSDIDELEAKAKAADLYPQSERDWTENRVKYRAATGPDVILDLIRRVREAEAERDVCCGAATIADAERDAALALREDAETKCAVLEANLSNYVARLREEKAAAESAVRTVSMRVEEVQRERDAALASVEAMRVERDALATALRRLVAASNEITHWDWSHMLLDHEDCETLKSDAEYLEECACDAVSALREHGKAGGT
jgi:uncharacterized coiled-coil DUF342 family protein